MKKLIAVCLLFVPLIYAQDKMQAPAKTSHGAHPMANAKAGDFKAEVQKLADEWKAGFQAKDADKVATLYTDDAVWVNPEGTFHGTGDIKGHLKKMIDRGDTIDDITTVKAVHSGDIGYAEGTYRGNAPDANGKEVPSHGSWVVTLKQNNDKWMLATDTSLAAAPAPMAKAPMSKKKTDK
jgi:uncharacterized protein (TIGR02246 family)